MQQKFNSNSQKVILFSEEMGFARHFFPPEAARRWISLDIPRWGTNQIARKADYSLVLYILKSRWSVLGGVRVKLLSLECLLYIHIQPLSQIPYTSPRLREFLKEWTGIYHCVGRGGLVMNVWWQFLRMLVAHRPPVLCPGVLEPNL